ncbi:MAG: SRPBCC family protein [Ekhidna sp.]
MPKIKIERAITIEATSEKVFNVLNDFNQWPIWSPWLLMEPEAKVTVARDGRSYEWEGSRVGSGNMSILDECDNESIDFDLIFLKPWKSKARTSFKLQQEGSATKVTWVMDSSLPFFMFFMKRMMEAFVGADYERGLDMLKAYVETGTVLSRLDFKGYEIFDGNSWVGVNTTCSIDDTEKRMPEDFGKIWSFAEKNPDLIDGEAFTIYHKWDLVKNIVSYTAAIPVKKIPEALPEGFVTGQIPATRVYVLRHVGRYQHLGNAWSTLYSMQRNKEFKPKKGIHPFEVYRNNPATTPENELIADIHFAVK